MSKPDVLPAAFLEPVIEYAHERALPAPALLAALNGALDAPGVPALDFCDFLEQLWTLDPVPALGLRLGLACQPRHFGVVGYMVSACGTLGQALLRYHRYHALLQGGLVSRSSLSNGCLHMAWTQAVANTPRASEYSLAAFITLCQALIGRPIKPIRAGLPFPAPDDAGVYQALLGCPVEFGCEAIELSIPAHLLALPITSKDSYLLRLLEQQAQALLDQRPHARDDGTGAFFAEVQDQIVEAMKNGDASAEAVARALGMSTRSFYRLLSRAGYSYRGLLAHVRHTLARQYLADPALAQTDVALLLGYAEQSSFIRAFRGWTGMTPGEYRQQRARGVSARDAGQLSHP